jgi:hypothetical protein
MRAVLTRKTPLRIQQIHKGLPHWTNALVAGRPWWWAVCGARGGPRFCWIK